MVAPPPHSVRRRLLAALLSVAVVGLVGSSSATDASTVHVVQLNLCNSGWAGCYTGRSVAEAASVIRARDPDVVTLNEICRDDAYALARMPGTTTRVVAFQPAMDRRTGGPVRCRDGEPYGIGVLSRVAGGRAAAARGGIFPMQDPSSPEARAWLCGPAADAGSVCTTHLAHANPLIALAQCRYLFTTVVAAVRGPVVVGGDFNLDDLSVCLPPGYSADSDGGVQFVVAPGPGGSHRARLVGMADTTDHPALVVALPRIGAGAA